MPSDLSDLDIWIFMCQVFFKVFYAYKTNKQTNNLNIFMGTWG